MDAREALAGVAAAVNKLLSDQKLAQANPSEWPLTADLAIRMVPHFDGWRVSPEWDRREAEEKKIAWNDEEGKRQLKEIRPDIIVHHMLEPDNLIVVEAKRSSHRGDCLNDIRKLTLMTKSVSVDPRYHYGYKVGLHIVIDMPRQRLVSAQAYADGHANGELTAFFLSLLAGAEAPYAS